MNEDKLILVALIIAAIVFVCVVIRELLLWYWKIPDMMKNQEEQIRLLKKIAHEEPEREIKESKKIEHAFK